MGFTGSMESLLRRHDANGACAQPPDQPGNAEQGALSDIGLSYMGPLESTTKSEAQHSEVRDVASFADETIVFKSNVASAKHIEVMIVNVGGVRSVYLVGTPSMPGRTHIVPALVHMFGFGWDSGTTMRRMHSRSNSIRIPASSKHCIQTRAGRS